MKRLYYELVEALRIVDRGDIELPVMKGSWAGAMGQTQFMPSSYLKHAEDFDGDGALDLATLNADDASVTLYANIRQPTAVPRAVSTGGQLPVDGLADDTNARHFAGLNFTAKNIGSAIDYARRRDVRVFLAVNTYPQPKDFERWCRAIDRAAARKQARRPRPSASTPGRART